VATVERVEDERAAVALAALLNGDGRRRPVVVVTIPAGRTTPWIDVDHIAREAGKLADVYLMPTGPFTWEFSHRMAEGTQVYGGAGRVYPVGHEWTANLSKSPLRFAFDAEDGKQATAQLISDLLRMAAASGAAQAHPVGQRTRVRGAVRATIAGRALVDVGKVLPAGIAEELMVEDVPIERIVAVGQQIEGWYDPETNRIDVTASLRSPAEALASYARGDVVLAKVAMVRNGKAELTLYPRTTRPGVTVPVLRADVTGNAADDLRSLMTVGEVVAARITAAGPQWAVTLLDVDDDEPIRPAPALLPGGPAWLVDEEPEQHAVVEPVPPQPTAPPMPTSPVALVAVEPLPPELPPSPRPTPALLGHHRPRPGAPSAARPSPRAATGVPSESTRALLLKIDGLAAEVRRLGRALEEQRGQLLAATDANQQLRYLLDHERRRANKAEDDLRITRSKLRKAATAKPPRDPGDGARFADPEQGFRYLVTTAWATRTMPSEQADRPLPEYDIGEKFVDSLERIEGVSPRKVADVVFEIVTGLAAQLPGREVHQLRTGSGGDDPTRIRDDGAVCWRANLQSRTAAARRIHYWVLPGGRVELARVVTHDDFEC
jgi:hypothetical protein